MRMCVCVCACVCVVCGACVCVCGETMRVVFLIEYFPSCISHLESCISYLLSRIVYACTRVCLLLPRCSVVGGCEQDLCCSVLQYVAVCCSVLQYVAVCCCNVSQCNVLWVGAWWRRVLQGAAGCCWMLQFVAVRCVVHVCSVLLRCIVELRCSELHDAMSCSELQ